MNLRFESAINPYGCSPRAAGAMEELARSKDYRFYGDASAEALRAGLAAHHDLRPENFIVLNGSGEALVSLYLLQLVLRKGGMIVPYPSYERFVEAGKRFATSFTEVPLAEETWEFPGERFVAEINRSGALLALISSPNNPTGNLMFDRAGLRKMAAATPECLWVVDEAYGDYSGTTMSALVNELPNLVILRTFSKAYGMAGLRVGYAVSNPALIRQMSQVRLPWNVNSMSLTAAETALADQEYLRETVGQINTDTAELYEKLTKFESLTVYPTDANFFLIKVSDDKIGGLKDELAARGIVVRTRPDMPEYIRVTSLLPEENKALIEALADLRM